MRSLALVFAVALGAALAAPRADAQAAPAATPLKRTITGQHPLSVPGREVVQANVELAAGGVAPRHTHKGEEVGTILEGAGVLEIAGQPPQELKAGSAFFIPAGAPHLVRNTGSVTLKLVAVYIVEAGQPLATPAP
jgi:quercetin dioxygenase-like cupin family protein